MAKNTLTRRQLIERAGAAGLLIGGGSAIGSAGEAAAAPRRALADATLRVGVTTDVDTLSPLNSVNAPELHWLVYDKLMVYDARLRPTLSLARSRVASPDGKTITFKLHDGARFHDGKPLTSADVAFTFDLIHRTQLSFAGPYLRHLKSVSTPDRLTVVAKYTQAPADDPAVMTPIMPKHLWQGKTKAELVKDPNSAMIGSGPFKFSKWEHNRSYTIVRNDDYWGRKPAIDGVAWIVYKSPETLALALRQGEVDVTVPLSSTIWEGLKGAKDVVTKSYLPLEFHHFGVNVWTSPKSKGNPLLKDKTLRHAFAHMIDRKKLVELVLEGQGLPGTTIIPPAMKDWYPKIAGAQQLVYDPSRAKKLLDSGGYVDRNKDGIRESRDGKPLHFRLYASTSLDALRKSAELIIPMAKEVGIRFDLTVMDDASLIKRVFAEGDWDVYVWSWTTPPNPTFMLSVESCTTFHTLSDAYYCNPTYEKLFTAQGTETNFRKRQRLVYAAQKRFYEDAAYVVLYYPTRLQAYRTGRFTGWLDQLNGLIYNWTTDNFIRLRPK